MCTMHVHKWKKVLVVVALGEKMELGLLEFHFYSLYFCNAKIFTIKGFLMQSKIDLKRTLQFLKP